MSERAVIRGLMHVGHVGLLVAQVGLLVGIYTWVWLPIKESLLQLDCWSLAAATSATVRKATFSASILVLYCCRVVYLVSFRRLCVSLQTKFKSLARVVGCQVETSESLLRLSA